MGIPAYSNGLALRRAPIKERLRRLYAPLVLGKHMLYLGGGASRSLDTDAGI